MRKVVGSGKGGLIRQFLVESTLYSFLALLIGIIIAVFALPIFNSIAEKTLVIPWTTWWVYPIMIGIVLIVGMLSGIYPAFYLSTFRPIEVLKGNLVLGTGKSYLRNSLVVFQFAVSIILISSTIIVYQQMNYILDKELGFNKDQVMLLKGTHSLKNKAITFKKELLEFPEIEQVSIGDYLPIQDTKRNGNGFWLEGKTETEKPVPGQFWVIDHDYIPTLGMNLLDGRNFSPQIASDSQSFIVNETLVAELGIKDPIGTRITNGGGIGPIIGVVEDFHYESMRKEIEPLCLTLGNSPTIMSLRMNPNQMGVTIDKVKTLWDQFAPHQAIRYTFLDERFAAMYSDVQRTARIFTSFALLAILVACLGLFGLSAYFAEQRRKEIGIRKVLGASVGNLLQLLTQHHLKLVLIAMVISGPLAWYLMSQWLTDFEYRISINAFVFVFAGVLALLIAIFTISYQAINSAFANPTDALKAS